MLLDGPKVVHLTNELSHLKGHNMKGTLESLGKRNCLGK